MKDYGVHRPGTINSIADGYSQLAISVILQARKDKSKSPLYNCICGCGRRNYQCVIEFYDSGLFMYYSDVAQVDSGRTRALL